MHISHIITTTYIAGVLTRSIMIISVHRVNGDRMEINMKATIDLDLLRENHTLMDVIRCYPNMQRTQLATKLGLSFPTMSSRIKELTQKNIIISKKDLRINPDYFWMCGISIGGTHTIITLVDAAYHVIDHEYFEQLCTEYNLFDSYKKNIEPTADDTSIGYRCFETPKDRTTLAEKLNNAVNEIIRLKKISDEEDNNIPPIISIGISVSGYINTASRIITHSENVPCLDNTNLDLLLSVNTTEALYENNISIHLDQNVKAQAVCDKFSLYQETTKSHEYASAKNIASLYLNSGIGCGLIMDNRLIRGTANLNGEIGKIIIPRCPNKINSGKKSSIEYCGYLEDLIIRDFFSEFPADLNYLTATPQEVLNALDEMGANKQKQMLKALGYYLNIIIQYLTQLLNVELIIFSGIFTSLYDHLWLYIQPDSYNPLQAMCNRIKSPHGMFSSSIGAAILSNYAPGTEIRWYD